MSTFYQLWKSNALSSDQAAFLLALLGLSLVAGWLLIRWAILSLRWRLVARYLYTLSMIMLAVVVVIWFTH